MKATKKPRVGAAQHANKPSAVGANGFDDDLDGPIGEIFDPINLRDRVVIKLLFDQVVKIEQVEAAWYRWRQKQQHGQADELWRVLAEDPGLDREAVFSEASTIYAFKKFNVPKSSVFDFIKRKGERFSNEQWEKLAQLCVLPAASLPDEETGELQWIFITHDPLRSEINQYLRSLGFKRFEVCYASETLIREILKETVQARNEFLERINDDDIAFEVPGAVLEIHLAGITFVGGNAEPALCEPQPAEHHHRISAVVGRGIGVQRNGEPQVFRLCQCGGADRGKEYAGGKEFARLKDATVRTK